MIQKSNVVPELNKFLERNDLVYPKIRKKNKIKVEGNIAYVYPNSKNYKGSYFVIDVEYLPIIEKFVWFYKDEYAVTTIKQKDKRKNIRMHRLLMGVLNFPDIEIDHINGDKNDNRICNLRECIKGQDADNQANINLHFEFPEVVDLFKHSGKSLFIMEVSNGIYEKVQIPYHTYTELIQDRNYLYENGMDIGLPIVLWQKYQELSSRLEGLPKDSCDYKDLLYFINQFLVKKEEAEEKTKTNYVFSLLIEAGIKVDEIELDRPYFINGTIVVIPSGKSSKEKYMSKVYMKVESNLNREFTVQ